MVFLRRPENLAARHRVPSIGRVQLALLLAAVIIAGWLSPRVAAAQSSVDGAVEGRATTLTGAGLAGARVVLQSLDGLPDRLLTSAADGSFVIPHVPPGRYIVAVTTSLSRPARSQTFTVQLGQTTQVNVGELLSAADISINVTAAEQPDEPATTSTIDHDSLTQMPEAQPRWQDFALTAPGVHPDQDGDGLVSAHGLPSDQNTVLVDGQETTQAFRSVPAGSGSDPTANPDDDSDSAEQTSARGFGLARGRRGGAAFTFSQAAVREFRVSSLNYSAQTSHGAGVVVESVSREGTSTLHGGGSFQLRSQLFAAHQPFALATSYADGAITSAAVKPHDLREGFAAWLGGPVRLSARRSGTTTPLTFFYAADLQRRGFPAISTPADPLFYQLTPTQTALLGTRGLSAAQTNAALNYLSSLTGETSRRADQTVHFIRLDWNPRPAAGPADRHGEPSRPAPPASMLRRAIQRPGLSLGLSYNHAQWSAPAGLAQSPTVAAGRASLGNAAGSLDSALLRVTSVANEHLVNQLRFGFLRDLQFEAPQPSLPQEPRIGPGGHAPEVNIAPNGLLFGTPGNLSRSAAPKEQRISVEEVLTLVLGRHLIEAGGSAALVEDHIASQPNPAGTFLYDSNPAKGFAGGLVDFITDYTFNVNHIPNGGCPAITATTHLFCFRSFTQSFGQTSASFRTADYAAFLEDTWQARAGLTLHAGLRYEYTLLPLPQRPNATLDTLFGARGATSVFPEDRNNVGPRVALAYSPGRSPWRVRAGFGFFYGRLPGATILAALTDTAMPASVTRLRIRPATVTTCPQVPTNGFGYPCSFTAAPPAGLAASTSAVVFDRHLRLPVVAQGSFSLERRLSSFGDISAGYLFDLDRQLTTTSDLNIAPATTVHRYQLQGGTGAPGVRDGETFDLHFYTTRLSPSFGPVTDLRSSVNATYHSLVIAAALRPAPGLRVTAHYTWSKAIDNNPQSSATPRTNNQLDPFVNGYDKGLSALNYPHTLHAGAVWQPVVHTPNRLSRHLLNGWLFAPVVAVHSGRPYSFDLAGGSALPGGHLSLNGSGGALYLPTVGRNTLRQPPVVSGDLRFAREAGLGGVDSRMHVTASADVFNLLNHRNVSAVSQRAYLVGTPIAGVTPLVFQDAATIAAEGLNTRPFGTPTSASTNVTRERQVEFGLRLEF